MRTRELLTICGLIFSGFICSPAQTDQRLAYKQPYPFELKRPDKATPEAKESLTHILRVDGVQWLRLHVADYKLGNHGYITITSLRDGGVQRLDAKSLPDWRNNTAFFNGDAVKVELHIDKEPTDIYVRFKEITVGLVPVPVPDSPETICGANDDRTAINDAPIGRINALNNGTNTSNPFCTAWAISNGAFLTAGHCVDADPDNTGPLLPDGIVDAGFLASVVEFNVPASLANGTTVFSNPIDQYPINQVTGFEFAGTGMPLGRDWSIFSVSPNSNSGLLPHPSRGFYRMTDQLPTATTENVRVSGYGIDNTPAGTTGGFNAQHATLQSHTSTYQGQTQASGGTFHSYVVDTTGGNSGSPIVWSNNPLHTIGIHTNGGCTSTGGSNVGTGFGHDQLENAVQNFWGANTIYVDSALYPNLAAGQRDGSIFRPHSTLGNGLNATPTGGNLVLTPNTYTGVTTFNRAMTIRAPAGTATIFP